MQFKTVKIIIGVIGVKRKISILLVLVMIMGILSGCEETYYIHNNDSEIPVGDQEDNSQDEIIDNIVQGGTQYERALKLLSQISGSGTADENIMISPISIEIATSMALNGMEGQAKEDLEQYLGHDTELLNEIGQYEVGRTNETLSIANSLWVRDTYKDLVNSEFEDTLRIYYDSEVNYFNNSVKPINDWVSEKTNGMIPSIMSEISPELTNILLNAVYFDGKWIDEFEEDKNTTEDFTLKSGEKVKAKFMNDTVSVYMENSQATAFVKRYSDNYEFIGILPKEDTFDINTFNLDTLLETYSDGKYDVNIKIPKFEYEYQVSLVKPLSNLGLSSIFGSNSMSKVLKPEAEVEIGISDILHSTAIRMDEKGTEASAATAYTVGITAFVEPEIKEVKEVYLNRPFYYVIMDEPSDTILFIGYVSNPTV